MSDIYTQGLIYCEPEPARALHQELRSLAARIMGGEVSQNDAQLLARQLIEQHGQTMGAPAFSAQRLDLYHRIHALVLAELAIELDGFASTAEVQLERMVQAEAENVARFSQIRF